MARYLFLLLVLALVPAAAAQDPADTTPPQPSFSLLVEERDAIVEKGKLRFAATADEVASMRLKAVVRAPGRLVLSRFVDANITAPGVRRVVTITLTARAKRTLAKLRRGIRLELTGRATDAAGNVADVDEILKIRAR